MAQINSHAQASVINSVGSNPKTGAEVRIDENAEEQGKLLPAVYRERNERIEGLQHEDDLRMKAPTSKELHAYRHTMAYYERGYEAVLHMDKAKDFRASVRSANLRRAKARKKDVARHRAHVGCIPDPNSNEEDSKSPITQLGRVVD